MKEIEKINWIIRYPNQKVVKFKNINYKDFAEKAFNNENNICQGCGKNNCFTLKTLLYRMYDRFPKHKLTVTKSGIKTMNIDCTGRLCNDCHRAINWNKQDFSKVTNKQRKARIENMSKINDDFEIKAFNNFSAEYAIKRKHKITRLFLYYAEIVEDSTKLKIGVAENIYKRLNHPKSKITYTSVHKLTKGGTKKMLKLEYELKLKFCDRNSKLSTELIDKKDLRKVKEFIKNYK